MVRVCYAKRIQLIQYCAPRFQKKKPSICFGLMSILISFIYNNYLTTYLSKFEVLIIT